MSRAVGVERPRRVRPDALGIPDQAIEEAARRPQQVPADRREGGVLGGDAPAHAPGSVVAFYAAQPFEESPELPRPADAPPSRENYYGLLSYTLTTAMMRWLSPLTYRDLAQVVASLDPGRPSFAAPDGLRRRRPGPRGARAAELARAVRFPARPR